MVIFWTNGIFLADKRMKLDDFIKNLRNIDDGADIERDMLVGIYERVKNSEFKPGADHVTQVLKVQQSIVGNCPQKWNTISI